MKPSLKDRIIAPSTRNFFKQGRLIPGYRLRDWLHGYIYSRWVYLYIAIGIGEHPLARRFTPWVKRAAKWFNSEKTSKNENRLTWADTYHGKVIPLETAHQLDLCIQMRPGSIVFSPLLGER